MTAGGDFSMGAEYAAIGSQVGEAMGLPGGAGHHHFPYARPMRLGWYQDAAGAWAYTSTDERWWEVICQQCGDTDGPAENQGPQVRELRGPYRSKRQAQRAAKRHYKKS